VGLCAHLREETEGELLKRDRKIGILEGEIRELKGMLGATLTLLGKSDTMSHLKSADVVELPHGFLRRVQNG